MDFLLQTVTSLASARALPDVAELMRRTARSLTGADGISFVLREQDQCYYAEEDAIAPLWKGKRFPLTSCISGWVMLNRQIAVVPDIYADARIPHEAYRQTFVKSLIMVPVLQSNPIAAIGAYWAARHEATWAEQHTLQLLANAAGIALQHLKLHPELASGTRATAISA
jgi:GAF domain-containing protein